MKKYQPEIDGFQFGGMFTKFCGYLHMKIVIIASFAPSIINFRKSLILALRQHAKIIVYAPFEDEKTSRDIIALGVEYKTYFLISRGRNPLHDLRTKRELMRLLKNDAPDIVLSYTIKPVIWGSIAAHKAGIKKVYSMITGLGYAFTEINNLKSRLIQKIAVGLYKKALKYNEVIFFQNQDDRALFQLHKIIPDDKKTIVLNGSGVDLNYYEFSKPYSNPIRFLLIARLLKDKGLIEYIEAAKIIKKIHPDVEFHLVGYIDSNPSAISQDLLNDWIDQKTVVFHGKCDEVRPVIRSSGVYVLPSYREGTPRSVLEAMSMGRAIITTDAPGCRETVIDGYNGYLVPIKNIQALVEAMNKIIENPQLIEIMGIASRKLAERKYDVQAVNHVILKAMKLEDA